MNFRNYLTEDTVHGLLSYPGGKKRVAKEYISKYFPKEFGNFYEPFMGGCSVSLHVCQDKTKKVYCNDLNKNVYNFWKNVQDSPKEMCKKLITIRNRYDGDDVESGEKLLKKMDKTLLSDSSSDFDKAVAYFILNKINFSGMTETPSLSKWNYKNKFNITNIKKIIDVSENIKNIKFSNKDYAKFLNGVKENDLIYFDPPYKLEDNKNNLYGRGGNFHNTFDHDRFANVCKQIKTPWVISYNDCPEIKENFKDFKIKKKKYLYTLSHKKDDKGELKNQIKTELLITNF
jgi:DNA adenine methylase